ncbi:Ig-like domain-containing protein [Neobacillus sp. YX16]|uniref:Ig-like domain-containing protein n=1 Tax=Neobacillus sp. YX16 TaxID=3047874 RepID=UPI0024C2DAE0|nr:Ig-like domain-containing protein [Neobacillus sp. YX16]WHZ02438.1 Ig-like domain-containing protein [Neobacillus sp. YX16]
MKRLFAIFLVIQLVLINTAVYAQEQQKASAPKPKINMNAKSMSAKISVDGKPRQSRVIEADFNDPSTYPLMGEGEFVDYLFDSYATYQYFYFMNVTDDDYDSDLMNVQLYYGSEDAYIKDRIFTVEFFKEESNRLNFLGYIEIDTYGSTEGFINSAIPKADFTNEAYIYMRAGVSDSIYSEYFSDTITFKVANPFYSTTPPLKDDKYAVISNESIDAEFTQPTGTFNLRNMKYTFDKNLEPSAYRVDVNKPFDAAGNRSKLIRKSQKSIMPSYRVGDTKYFWVTDITTDGSYELSARLAYSGTKANVWVGDYEISDYEAQQIGQEFDSKIYSTVTSNFGRESDINGDGKINILTYDIQDGFNGSGGFVGGYFWSGDLYNVPSSNQSEIFYIDTYPSMGTGSQKDLSSAYETLAHEFQHMVNFNQNALIEGNDSDMDIWLDEGLSMAAEQIYTGKGLSDRLNYYNSSSAIQNGHSLLYWDYYGDMLSNYSLSYLFAQYIKIQTNQGNRIFKEIMNDQNNNYRAVENVAKKYINPNMTFGKLMTNFRIALLLKLPTGLYGFKGDPFFNGLEKKIFSGNSLNLRGGGSVVTTYSSKEGWSIPSNKGADITYTSLNMDGGTGGLDVTPPAAPALNLVSDQHIAITGTVEANAIVYAKVDQTEIGRSSSSESGAFSIDMEKQKAGILIQVYAVDQAGNVSPSGNAKVQDKTAPTTPVVGEITDADSSITGQAEPGSLVEVKRNSSLIASGTVEPDGVFSVAFPIQASGTKLDITAADKAGNVSEKVTMVVNKLNAPKQPTVTLVTDHEKVLIGVAEPETTVIAKVSGKEIGKGNSDGNGKFSISIPKQNSGAIVEIFAIDKTGNASSSETVTVTKKLQKAIGETRYTTATNVSQMGWERADTVLLVNGRAIVDGLTATPLAAAKNAPILLTTTDSVPIETFAEIARLKAKEIILIGGTGVISTKVETALTAKGYQVSRIGGLTRHNTSLLIARELDKLIDVNTIYMAYGWGEPDALSIAAQAGQMKQPIILTDKTTVPSETLTWLKNESLDNAYFIGGSGVIASSIISEINKISTKNVANNRISGLNRQETNANVIRTFYTGLELPSILIAKSETENLVDALSAGPLAAKLKSPVLLVSYLGLFDQQKQVLSDKQSKYVHQIGGGVNSNAINEVVK